MIIESIWLVKLVLAHLITDFVLQPTSWVEDRNNKHYASLKLYLHGFVTASLAWIMIGWQYWPVGLVILVTHIAIDGWKSYQKQTVAFFLIDQLMHLAVMVSCWYFTFINWDIIKSSWQKINSNEHLWTMAAAFVFITTPAGILIGQLTKQWRDKVDDPDNGLSNAGKWIGIIERIIVLILLLQNQYSAIGLLVTAKGIIRFQEKERQEVKTEYLVIGTLLSIGISIVTGIILKTVLQN